MVKLPFGRNKSESKDKVPEEIQEYYESERRERVGVAWMLALATLVVTVILALALFYGGRWVYRSIFEDDEPATTQEQSNQEQAQDETDNNSDQPATLPGDASDNSENDESEEETPETTPVTGPALPETGPSDNL